MSLVVGSRTGGSRRVWLLFGDIAVLMSSWAVVHDLSIEQHYRVQEVLVIGIRFLFNDSTGKMVNIFQENFRRL